MAEFLIRLLILFTIVAGAVFGLTRALKKAKNAYLLEEQNEAIQRLQALKESYEEGDLTKADYVELSQQIKQSCKDKGLSI